MTDEQQCPELEEHVKTCTECVTDGVMSAYCDKALDIIIACVEKENGKNE